MATHILTSNNVATFIEQLNKAPRIALDTEFHAERRFFPKLFLVQVYIPDADTWLIDPTAKEVFLEQLAENLTAVPWVLHSGKSDLVLMNKALGKLPDTVFDTQIAAGLLDHAYPTSYAKLVSKYLGRTLKQEATLSNWARRPLTPAQREYAAEDVQSLLLLASSLKDALVKVGRLEIAQEACEEARVAPLNPPAFDLIYREHQGLHYLTAHQAAVFQELAAWRLQRAMQSNQPVRSVLNDSLMLEWSKRQPSSIAEMLADRRVSKKLTARIGDEVLELIERAQKRPEWGWPTFISRYSPEWMRHNLLCNFVECLGYQEGFSSRLVAPRKMMEQLILVPPDSRETIAGVLGPWRDGLVGEAIWKFLNGETSLRLPPDRKTFFIADFSE
jgi:ribonuclease D